MELDEPLRQLKRELQALYGDRLRGLCLFGSRARGDAAPDSDVDVAVVPYRVDSVFEQIHHMGGIGSRISVRSGSLARRHISSGVPVSSPTRSGSVTAPPQPGHPAELIPQVLLGLDQLRQVVGQRAHALRRLALQRIRRRLQREPNGHAGAQHHSERVAEQRCGQARPSAG
ncbi:MAG: nucleotidyltransferase family protein [Armatimonadota bacterium]